MNKYSTIYGACMWAKIFNLAISACIKQKPAYNGKNPVPSGSIINRFHCMYWFLDTLYQSVVYLVLNKCKYFSCTSIQIEHTTAHAMKYSVYLKTV
jgi:hypothetical protein